MRPTLIAFLLLFLLTPGGAFAKEKKQGKKPKPKPHTDVQLKEHKVLEKFKAGWKKKDVEERMDAVRRLGQWKHKKVLKELKKIWLKDRDMELVALAAQGIGNQDPFKKEAGKALIQGLVARKKLASRPEPTEDEELDQTLEARALAAGIRAVATLDYRDGWDDFKGFCEHFHDDVAGAWMEAIATMKEYRALPQIKEWFNFYPDGYSWSGGSVRVDTGAAGNKDAKAAKAKWHGKFGGRKRKARPNVWEKMVVTVEALTGEKMKKPAELKAWMKKNKLFLKKQGL